MHEVKTDDRQLVRKIVRILVNMRQAESGADVFATAQGKEQS